MSKAYAVIRFKVGTSVRNAAREAVEYAAKHDCCVAFEINGMWLYVGRLDDYEEVMEQYELQLGAMQP